MGLQSRNHRNLNFDKGSKKHKNPASSYMLEQTCRQQNMGIRKMIHQFYRKFMAVTGRKIYHCIPDTCGLRH